MATTVSEEVLRIKIEKSGDEKLAALTAILQRLDAEIADLRRATANDPLEQLARAPTVAKLEANMGRVRQEIIRAQAAMGGVTGSTKNVGHAVFEASRAIEDLQYGFNGVVNNIPGVVMALGGGAGLAAAFSLVSIAMNQVIKHLPELLGGMDPEKVAVFSDSIRALNLQLEDLKERQLKIEVDSTAVDAAEKKLDEATKAIERFNAVSKGQTEEEAAAEKAATKIVTEAKMAGPIQEAVRNAMLSDPKNARNKAYAEVGRLETEKKNAEDAAMASGDPLVVAAELLKMRSRGKELEQAKAIAAQADTAVSLKAEEFTGDVLGGKTVAINQLQGMAANKPEIFSGVNPQTIRDLMSHGTPEGVAKDKALKEATEAREKREAEAKRLAEQQAREAEAKARQDQRDADQVDAAWAKQADQVGDAAGVVGQLQAGQDPAEVANRLYQDLVASGASVAEATRLAGEAVMQGQLQATEAQRAAALQTLGAFRENVQFNAGTAREMARLRAQNAELFRRMMRGQGNPGMGNNRAGWP